MADNDICEVCWQGTKLLQNGMLVCDFCGTVDQGFTQETAEIDFENTGRVRKLNRSTRQAHSAPLREKVALVVENAVDAYVQELQSLIQRQADDLERACGVDRAIRPILRSLWLKYVRGSRVLSPEWIDGVQEDVYNSQLKELPEALGRSPALSIEDKPHMILSDRLAKILPPAMTLSLCLIACWAVRAPVDALDVVRWALHGRLSYLAFWAYSEAVLRHYSDVLHPRLVHPRGTPTPHKVHHQAVGIAAWAGVPVPPAPYASWIDKWTRTLGLGPLLRDLAVQLSRTFPFAQDGAASIFSASTTEPSILDRAAAALLVALRLVYSLDRRPARDVHGSLPALEVPDGFPPAPKDWAVWAECAMHVACASGIPGTPSIEDVCHMPPRELALYLARVRATFFSRNVPDAKMEEYLVQFDNIADEDDRATGPDEWFIPEFVGMRMCDTTHNEPSSRRDINELVRVCDETRISPATARAQTLRLTHLGHTRALQDLPRDYAAVLAVVSAMIWTDPLDLHLFVHQLEKHVLSAEVSLEYELNGALEGSYERVVELQAEQWARSTAYLKRSQELNAKKKLEKTKRLYLSDPH